MGAGGRPGGTARVLQACDDPVAVGLLELVVEGLGGDLDRLAGPVDHLVRFHPQAPVLPGRVLGQPADDVPPELAEVAVVPLAPGPLEVGAPGVGRIGGHGERSAPAVRLAGEDRHGGGSVQGPVGDAQDGRGRLQAVDQVGPVEGGHPVEDRAVPGWVVDDPPDRVILRRGGDDDAEVAVVERRDRAQPLAVHVDHHETQRVIVAL